MQTVCLTAILILPKKKGAKNGNGTLLQLIPFIWAFLKEFYSNF